MENISACVITFNDEHTVAPALNSVRWTDEVLVVDTGSTDRTVEIAQSLGARVVRTPPLAGFGELRTRALEHCSHEWVFSLDADEHCTPALQDEIAALLAAGPEYDAFVIYRHNYFMGRLIRGSGWYRDHRTPQLFRKSVFRYTPSLSHEDYELTTGGRAGSLKNVLLHYPFQNLEEVLNKANVYSSLGARAAPNEGASMWSALGHGIWAFIRLYVLRYGFIDGWAGFVIALSNFEGTFYRYAKRYEKSQNWTLPSDEPSPHSGRCGG